MVVGPLIPSLSKPIFSVATLKNLGVVYDTVPTVFFDKTRVLDARRDNMFPFELFN